MVQTLVFVYGTLKKDFYNYETYLKPAIELGKASFVGASKTAHPDFHLVLKKDRWVPCLYRAPDHAGYQVPGEIYQVDDDTLEALDILEAVAEKYYIREEISVELLEGEQAGEVFTCSAYIMPFRDDLLTLNRIPEYTEEHHVSYQSRTRTPKLTILKCIYGQELIDAVQTKIDEGMSFEDAWKAAALEVKK